MQEIHRQKNLPSAFQKQWRMFFRTAIKKTILILLVSALFMACSTYYKTNQSHKRQLKQFARELKKTPPPRTFDSAFSGKAPAWVGTTNFGLRKPNFVIIHHTAQNSCEQTLKTFTLTRTQVSAHYVICKDGTIHHMLNDYLRAWHAGSSKWGNLTDINSLSIGIELDNNGLEPFAEPQLQSLTRLLAWLKKSYTIPAANFIGHADIAPTRKNDPNIHFPWKDMAQKGFGLWYSDTTGYRPPPGFDPMMALRIVGYNIKDSAAAIQAFNRHFLQDTSRLLSHAGKQILYGLYRQY